MKNLLIIVLLALFFLGGGAYAQNNVYVWQSNGALGVLSSENVDSITFSGGKDLFEISKPTIETLTMYGFKASISVNLNDKVSSLSEPMEIGICYNEGNSIPTYDDDIKLLGNNIGIYDFSVDYLRPGTTYVYRIYVKLLNEIFYSETYSLTTVKEKPDYMIVNGHKFINLGLPSGVLWAECNIGANTSNEYGDYFAWGEIATQPDYLETSYKWFANASYTKYNGDDSKSVLEKGDDVAYTKWGRGCRIPKKEEFEELISLCKWKNTNGGWTVTGPNGNSIFLPNAGFANEGKTYNTYNYGFYWSSSLWLQESNYFNAAWSLKNASDRTGNSLQCEYRFRGLPVRPVTE